MLSRKSRRMTLVPVTFLTSAKSLQMLQIIMMHERMLATVLFRPCAMVVPDFELICEIMLVAEGFLEARLLARKFITLYSLCKELLSKQVRYFVVIVIVFLSLSSKISLVHFYCVNTKIEKLPKHNKKRIILYSREATKRNEKLSCPRETVHQFISHWKHVMVIIRIKVDRSHVTSMYIKPSCY